MTARTPLPLRQNTVEASTIQNINAGTRVVLARDKLDRETRSDALAIENISGWIVQADYRPTGNIIIEGRDWLGETRWMPVSEDVIRVEICCKANTD